MKLLAGVVGGLLTITSLSACTVSAEESKACADKEGIVVTRSFKMYDKNETQNFSFCEVNGKITKVFTKDEVKPPTEFADACKKEKGEIYSKEDKIENKGKNDKGEEVVTSTERKQSFICVADGAVVKSFYQSV